MGEQEHGRRLLCLAADGRHEGLHQVVRTAGWTLDVVTDPVAAGEAIRRGGYRVGLILLSEPEQGGWLERPMSLATANWSMQWIALVSSRILEQQRARDVIFEHCFDYHTLPVDGPRLLLALGHAWGMAALSDTRGAKTTADRVCDEVGLVGASPAVRAMVRRMRKIAATDAPVLITGESGTGKERIATAIHRMSPRAQRPLVPVNCAVLPPTLVQSELFGHERGAFTGAHQRQIGRIEVARGGTILLDEIGDLPLDAQANLLRFLEDRSIQRVGGTDHIPVDARVIAATHVDLEDAVRRQRFRADLYYRLDVLALRVPPLRERPGDVELIADHFFREFRAKEGGQVRGFSIDALQTMRRYSWPGNVRELMNRVRKAVVLCERRLISRHDLALDGRTNGWHATTLSKARQTAETEAILTSLERTGGNVSEAARQLCVSRSYLYDLMTKYDIGSRDGGPRRRA